MKQSVKDRYAHARDDAQRLGLIPTTPEESLTPERVNPLSQSGVTFPALIETAIRNGWAVPEDKKPQLIDELIEVATIPTDSENPKMLIAKVQAVNALHRADQMQYERDHPEQAAKAKGGAKVAVQINNENTNTIVIDPEEQYRKMALEAARDEIEERLEQEQGNEMQSDS